MSEICLDCLNQGRKRKLKEKDVILEMDLCEGCGMWKPCVVTLKYKNVLRQYSYHFFKK